MNGIVADPQYVNATLGELQIGEDSPAIGNGKIFTIPELNWSSSLNGKAPDIGAYDQFGNLFDGPKFQVWRQIFIISDIKAVLGLYPERPRIVGLEVGNNSVLIYFSCEILPDSSLSVSVFTSANVNLASNSCNVDGYVLECSFSQTIGSLENIVAVSIPKSIQSTTGLAVTLWASMFNFFVLV